MYFRVDTPATLIWHLVAYCRSTVDLSHQLCNGFHVPTVCLCVQVWDDTLAKTAEDWAHACMWEHGPPHLLRFLGQNLSVRTGRWVTFDSPTPLPDICCSSQGWLSFPPSAVMVVGFAAPFCVFSRNHLFLFFFHTVTQWLPQECSRDPSNKQKLCSQPWLMRAKTRLFSGSFLTFRSETQGTLMSFTRLGFTEEWYETQGRSAQSS